MNLKRLWGRSYSLARRILAQVRTGRSPSGDAPRIGSVLAWEECRPLLERMLLENVLPFWHPQAVDAARGGYRVNHDVRGAWKGPAARGIVPQARTLWFFSRLFRSPYGLDEHLKAARHGFAFLRDRMWDREFGGFYWEVDAVGEAPTMPRKHLYGQAFALYGLSEYAVASGDPDAFDLAARLFDLLEDRAHDPRHGGYTEFFRRDWSPAARDEEGYLGHRSEFKLMNTHLHLLEAVTSYHSLSGTSASKDRLSELIGLLGDTVVENAAGACTNLFRLNWERVATPEGRKVSYGHDLENISLLMKATAALDSPRGALLDGPYSAAIDRPGGALRDRYRTLFDYALRYGHDRIDGGFFCAGPLNATADNRIKVWWIQAEALLSALNMFRVTRDPPYRDVFLQTLRWIAVHQVDWKTGEWFELIDENGKASGAKAGAWKTAYHNGRAVLECLKILREVEAEAVANVS